MTNWAASAALGAILNGVAVGTALTAAIWLWLRLAPRSNATTRYAVWLAALAAVVALPFLMARTWPAASVAVAPASSGIETARLILPAPGNWFWWTLAAWAAVSLALLVRIVYAAAALRGLKRRARPIEEPWASAFEALRRRHAGRRRVRLAVSPEVRSPLAAGLLGPVILVPESLAGRLSEEEFRQILVHELAHIRRWDDWTCLAQKLVEALFFFHPGVLWIGRRLNLEREIACDDWVVSATGAARPYAACLTKLAAFGRLSRAPQLAPGAAARKPQISHRIESLLSRRRASSPRCSTAGALAGVGALAAGLLLGTQAAPIAVAGPDAAPPPGVASIAAPQMAYAPPRRPAPAAQRTRPIRRTAPQVVAAARPPRELVVVEQVTVLQPSDLTASYCILYWGAGQAPEKSARAGQRAPVREWLAVFWTVSPPVPKTPGQA